MDLKRLLMTLGNNLVTKRHFDPARVSFADKQNSTDPIRQFTEWLNETPEAVEELKELGIAWPMKLGESPLVISSPLGEGRLTVIIKGQIAGTDETYDGFNAIVDDYIGTALTDVKYRLVNVEGEHVWVEVYGEVNTE